MLRLFVVALVLLGFTAPAQAQDNNPLRDFFNGGGRDGFNHALENLREVLPGLGAQVDEGATRNLTLIPLYARTCQPQAEDALCSRSSICQIVQVPNQRFLTLLDIPDAPLLEKSELGILLSGLQSRRDGGNAEARALLEAFASVLENTPDDTVDKHLEAMMRSLDGQPRGCPAGNNPPAALRVALLRVADYMLMNGSPDEQTAARNVRSLF